MMNQNSWKALINAALEIKPKSGRCGEKRWIILMRPGYLR